jgi:hypothetical protein
MVSTVTTTIGVIAASATVGVRGAVVGVEAIAAGASMREGLLAAGTTMRVEATSACSGTIVKLCEKARTALQMQPGVDQADSACGISRSPPIQNEPPSLNQTTDNDWQCSACTLLNTPSYLVCEACGRERDAPESPCIGADSEDANRSEPLAPREFASQSESSMLSEKYIASGVKPAYCSCHVALLSRLLVLPLLVADVYRPVCCPRVGLGFSVREQHVRRYCLWLSMYDKRCTACGVAGAFPNSDTATTPPADRTGESEMSGCSKTSEILSTYSSLEKLI